MGRHRRATPTPSAPTEAPAAQHGAAPRGARRRGGSPHRRTKAPVRTGLLGASAALAMGAVAVASGLVPAPGGLGPEDGRVRADRTEGAESPAISGTPSDTSTSSPSEDEGGQTRSPSARPSSSAGHSSSAPRTSPSPSRSAGGAEREGGQRHSSPDDRARDRREPAHAGSGGGTAVADQESAAEQEVLTLVNQERAEQGCRPVRADGDLAALAGNHSEDMARRGFFSHTSPDGNSPWDRAEAAGVDDLGGENIARGQANARSVMDSWMNSPGHRANILNCDYRTLGVGAHFAEGGPWWTQDFGF